MFAPFSLISRLVRPNILSLLKFVAQTFSKLSRTKLFAQSGIAIMPFTRPVVAIGVGLIATQASAEFCVAPGQYCRGPSEQSTHSKAAPAYPTTSSAISINPATVPTDEQWGLGTIVYKGTPDFVVVKGTGRVGAAVSLTSGEDSFFGAPSFETNQQYFDRESSRDKYHSDKFSLGVAGTLFENGRDDLTHVRVSIGAMARYNRLTRTVLPGGGLSAIIGPFNIGFATSLDETLIPQGSNSSGLLIHDQPKTYSAGIFLTSVALDYSMLVVDVRGSAPTIVQLYTASLLLRRWILTAAYRIEDSNRPLFLRSSESFITQQIKPTAFAGVQYAPLSHLQLGLFYNYYLLNDISLAATLFF